MDNAVDCVAMTCVKHRGRVYDFSILAGNRLNPKRSIRRNRTRGAIVNAHQRENAAHELVRGLTPPGSPNLIERAYADCGFHFA
jgi:hypothetical protein